MKKKVLILLSLLFVCGHVDIFCMLASDLPDEFSSGAVFSKFSEQEACQRFFEIPVDLIGVDEKGFPTKEAIKNLSEQFFLKHFKGQDIHVKTAKQSEGKDRVYMTFIDPSKQDIRFVFKAYVGMTGEGEKAYDKGQDSYNNMKAIMHGPWASVLGTDSMKIVMPIGFFTYQHNGIKRYIEVTEGAGTAVRLGEMFCRSYLSYNAWIQSCFFGIGSKIGALHKKFMKPDDFMRDVSQWLTHLHGDLNLGNILWRYSLSKAFIIDLSDSFFSLNNRQSIDHDIIAFVFVPLLYWEWFDKGVGPVFIENCAFFLRGYVSAFSEDLRPKLIAYLKNIVARHFIAAQHVVNGAWAGKIGLTQEAINFCYAGRDVQTCRQSQVYEEDMWCKFIETIRQKYISLQPEDKEGYKRQLLEKFTRMSDMINRFDALSAA